MTSVKKPKSAMAAMLDMNMDQFSQNSNVSEEIGFEPKSIKQNKTTNAMPYELGAVNKLEDEDRESIIQEINPNECQLWSYADRPIDELGDIRALANSMKEHGQQEPVLVRKIDNRNFKYEIIFGNRRWRAAKEANLKLLAICKKITDKDAAIFQKEENENRKELSNYARAQSYKAQIDGGLFKTEKELSKCLGISPQLLNNIMAYLRVPSALRDSIKTYRLLSQRMVAKLAQLSKNKDTLEVLIHLAPKIDGGIVNTNNIEKYIHKYLGNHIQNSSRDKKETLYKSDSNGKIVYETSLRKNGDLSIIVKRVAVDGKSIEAIHEHFYSLLKEDE